MRTATTLTALALLVAPRLWGQTAPAEHIALGDSARAALHAEESLRHYQAAVEELQHTLGRGLHDTTPITPPNPLYCEALWKAAREISDVAKQILGNADSLKHRRDSLYSVGRIWAEEAIRADSSVANSHFSLALVLGRLSRTRGGKERVRFGRIIYDETERTIRMDPRHDGAYHILGMWNAEVKRLSGFTRFAAKTFLGAGFMSRASWDSAVANMERAVQLNPQHVYHRLELAGVYLDVEQPAKAKEQLQAIAALPDGDPMDPYYKRLAAAALADIDRGKADDADDRLRKG
ncbi:MAG TPA: tetratricopeptide repeat protein [Gemmatimonadales bacterium]|nr:tetratricopeptide repeat protein [Gemmatimonadales bacterium]